MQDDSRGAGTPLLFLGGAGRSGSTLLECMLAEIDQVTVLGEVNHLWERGVRNDELCACEQAFSGCDFWVEVGERAFGGWQRVDLPRLLRLKDAVDRQRRLPWTLRRSPGRRFRTTVVEYAEHYRRIYEAAAAVSGARVVVDSSKVAPTAMALSHHPDIDLRVLHIVRDARGVAHSWSKVVARPETRGAEEMPRMGTMGSTVQWVAHNLAIGGVARRGVPLVRLRYEDLVAEPAGALARSWAALDLPGEGLVPVTPAGTIELHGTHSVAGNPMRFRRGTTALQVDDAWRDRLSTRDRRLVEAVAWPALHHFGYGRER
ncbi:MAG: sulfotransferase [Microthrixaceae bacterium]